MSEVSPKQAAAKAENSAQDLSNLLEQLAKPEVQSSLLVLIDNLPKISGMLNELSATYEMLKNIATDPIFVEDIKGGFSEFVKPLEEKAKYIASAAVEANDRLDQHSQTIGVFGLMKMLKDPQTQKALNFVNSMLEVLNERDSRR